MLAKIAAPMSPEAAARMARIDDLVEAERHRVGIVIHGPRIDIPTVALPAPLSPDATRKQAKAHAMRVKRAQNQQRQALVDAETARRGEEEAEGLAPAILRRPVIASTGETIREALVEIDRSKGGSVRALRWLPAKMLVKGQITIHQSIACGDYLDLVEKAAGVRDHSGGSGEATPPWMRAGFTDVQKICADKLAACRDALGARTVTHLEATLNASTMDEARRMMHCREADARDHALAAIKALEDWLSGQRKPQAATSLN